jgi:hypothetical protein
VGLGAKLPSDYCYFCRITREQFEEFEKNLKGCVKREYSKC